MDHPRESLQCWIKARGGVPGILGEKGREKEKWSEGRGQVTRTPSFMADRPPPLVRNCSYSRQVHYM